MRTKPVHWSEGMLVLPHHFQASDANLRDTMSTMLDWRNPYGYGVRQIEWNVDALRNFELRINRLKVRLKDGTLISVPENTHLDILDIRPALQESDEVFLYLALPEIVDGRLNSTRRRDDQSVRSLVEAQDWADRNAAGNPRPIETERWNARLIALPSHESPKGFESLPIMRLRRSADAEAIPELDTDYIPSLLGCDAWLPLKEAILASICAQLGAFSKSQAEYIQTHGGWTEANQPQIRKAILQLAAVNAAYPYLRQLTEASGLHPFDAYTELCRIVGQLAIFRSNWQPPDLPLYDHDDLGRIFRIVKSEIELCLQSEGATAKVQRFPFLGVEEWMEVGLDPRWVRNRNLGFYVGVRSDLTPERLELFFSNRWLDWKLGSSRTITQIYRNGEAGLALTRVVGVHQSLPALQNVTYFEVDPRGTYWDQVCESRTLAIKVNERYIRGAFVGQNTLTVIDPKNTPRDLKLELFVVDNE